MGMGSRTGLSVYLSYSERDEGLKQEFEDYLVVMRQGGLISGWVERRVQRGVDWSGVVDERVLEADLVVVLVSLGLVVSGYCAGAEVREALGRSERREARVVPVMLQDVHLEGTPLEAILAVPRGRPVLSWSERSEAWREVEQEMRKVIRMREWGGW